jgi:hypothetical protein
VISNKIYVFLCKSGTYSTNNYTPGWGEAVAELHVHLSPPREAGLLTHVSEEFVFTARKKNK